MLGDLAARRGTTGWFKVADVAELLEAFRLPSPQRRHVSSRADTLVEERLLTERGAGRNRELALTPVGRGKVAELVGEVEPSSVEPLVTEPPGAQLGHAAQTVLPPALAPPKWAAGIGRMLERSAFDANVLCMTRFPEPGDSRDPNAEVIKAARAALADHGLVLHLASDRIVEDDLLGNVAAYMWACKYGVGLFEDRLGKGLNYNLVIEVGAMIMAGRRCALLRDTTAPPMPTDLVGQIYKPVDYEELASVEEELHLWAAEDLGLGRCARCPSS